VRIEGTKAAWQARAAVTTNLPCKDQIPFAALHFGGI